MKITKTNSSKESGVKPSPKSSKIWTGGRSGRKWNVAIFQKEDVVWNRNVFFKVKRNGVFQAILLACGYSQIPGVDFTKHFAPVVNDITYRIVLVASILWQLTKVIVDVETALLHRDL
jgi:hypothetical protein